MNPSKIDLSEALTALLARGEPLSAAQMAAATGKSQPSISLALGKLGERVHRMGAARKTRYALKKDILGFPAHQELRWLGANNAGFMTANLTYLAGDWLHVVCNSTDGRTSEWLTQHQLPWFLNTLRPQGYLGRKLARWLPHLPSDPAQWSLSQLLHSTQHISDPMGAIGVMSTLARPVHHRIHSLEDRQTEFDRIANEDTEQPTGSSAGGEQPKFVASICNQASIVKFTPPHGTPFGERWKSLLKLEKLALSVLQAHGISCARTEVVQTQRRTYLQSSRFDRDAIVGPQHIVAIANLHDEFVKGSWTNWITTSEALAKLGLITQQELQHIAHIFAFGHYIGNTDMHSGNLSFFVDDVIAPKIRLAPIYDMLPMMWRPDIHQGTLSNGPVRKQFIAPGFEAEKAQAREWAIHFWQQAALLDIGSDLQAACRKSAHRLTTHFADV